MAVLQGAPLMGLLEAGVRLVLTAPTKAAGRLRNLASTLPGG